MASRWGQRVGLTVWSVSERYRHGYKEGTYARREGKMDESRWECTLRAVCQGNIPTTIQLNQYRKPKE